ncbi:MAG TPA: alanyl-tRNA editing protein [candidate division Zixibacteria bacterium]|nr:alanyl-tRNA editing protein [candidate division Zixibacteria bacterium]
MTESIMTDRLYYRNQGLLDFDATIMRIQEQDGYWLTFLDRSAFYPTSGGQLHDTGKLNGIAVIEVSASDNGEVAHKTEQPPGRAGDKVHGEIDAERRWQHRQQHTAQHILSAVFLDLFDAPTVSVHLGADYGAVEFDRERFSEDQLRQAEDKANVIIREDYPVRISFVDGAEADEIPFRRPPKRTGKLRVVQIGDFEYAACGGTHCDSTGQVGLIKIIEQGKLRNHALVHFLSGSQTINDYQLRFEVTDKLSHSLTCGVRDLPEKIDNLLAQERELRQRISGLYTRMLPTLAEEVIDNNHGVNLVTGVTELPDVRLTAKLAALIAERTERLACLLNDHNLVLAAPERSNFDLRKTAKRLNDATNLKGGGSNSLVQFGQAETVDFKLYIDIIEESLSHE